jgi:polyphenol oxidase
MDELERFQEYFIFMFGIDMYCKDGFLIPEWADRFNIIKCGFSLPKHGNQAFSRAAVNPGKSTAGNRKELFKILNVNSDNVFYPYQIHMDDVIYIDKNKFGKGALSLENSLKGDACYTDLNNVLLMITWADCIPVLLFEPINKIIGAVHSGWKGTKLNIVSKTINQIRSLSKKRGEIFAAVGPGIRSCCYKVGKEFLDYFDFKNNQEFFRNENNELFFDLSLFVYDQIINTGIKKENIDFFGKCTACSINPEFFSCRKDGKENFEGQSAFIGYF